MVEMRGGVGGYGGITTMNQDQRQGKWYPHKAIVQHMDRMKAVVHVKCLHCGQSWDVTDRQMFDRDFGDVVPTKCKREEDGDVA